MTCTWKMFLKSAEGAALPLIAVSLAALVGSTAIAIDTGRMSIAQAKLSSSLDAAGLAASSTVNTANINSEVSKYLTLNFASSMGATLSTPVVTMNSDNTVITISASATIPATFGRVLGQTGYTVSATTEITRAINGLEVVLVLDNTGSMAGTPLTNLKSSATTLVNIVFGDELDPENLWVGLIPFSQAVNIGTDNIGWLDMTHYATLDWGPSPYTWGGCVDERTGGGDVTDTPPTLAANKFKAYHWPDDSGNNWISSGSYNTPFNSSRSPNKNCPQPLTVMTSDKNALLNNIQNMVATGATHINVGAVWGWRMLSPDWRGLWGGQMYTDELPLDYNTPKMSKAMVLMTDGDNTMISGWRSAYGYLSEGVLGTTDANDAGAVLDTRLAQVCTSAKSHNIIIYTIAFNNPSTASKNLLKNCASNLSFYFDASSATQLENAFSAIGDSLSELRISK